MRAEARGGACGHCAAPSLRGQPPGAIRVDPPGDQLRGAVTTGSPHRVGYTNKIDAMSPLFRGRVRRWHVAALLLGLGAVVALSGLNSWSDRRKGMRPASEQDELFRYVAQQIAEPALCAKIPWSAELGGGFFIAPSYERSTCYMFIAGRTKSPWLCWNVKRLGAFSPLSSQTSMWSCLRHAWDGLNSGIAVSPASLAGFFAKLGYDADTLHLEGITPPVVTKGLPPDRVSAAYEAFLEELNTNSDDAHTAARKRFIERVLSLP